MNRQEVDKFGPIGNHDLFFCGFHVAKQNPEFQVTTMHYCGMRGEGDQAMHQCLLYDSVGPKAKLLGVEYIVSDNVFRSLADGEKKYWHPHTYEVLGGGLVAPVMSDQAELDFMSYLLTTWGKSWHTWPDPTTQVPLGEPQLMWSLTGDGQANMELIAERDKQFGVSTAKIQAERVEALGYAVPQVPQPRSVATVGRQWTAEGEDRPTLVTKLLGCRSWESSAAPWTGETASARKPLPPSGRRASSSKREPERRDPGGFGCRGLAMSRTCAWIIKCSCGHE